MSKTVAITELQPDVVEMLENREEVLVLKDGEPFAKVVPIIKRPPKTLEEIRARGVKILGDIVEPLDDWGMTE
jgi:antitoxin (DNA-binding transcriptional repressor) of toxin-antitoxin stability system